MSDREPTADDDEFHPPTSDDPEWTETCWFSFNVPERKLSGQLYPFFRPNLGVMAAGVYVWDDRGSQMWNARYVKNHWNLPIPDQPLSDITIANGILDSDGIISLPKLKTHGFLKLTGAIKNQLGCIPGLLKSEYHVKLPDPKNFAKMLVDLNSFLKPRLYIMDGIIAMEGNGPMGGDPRPMNLLLFSTDPVALDATVCRAIQVNPELSFTITFGREGGLGTYGENEIELLGDPLSSFFEPKFSVDREPIISLTKRHGLYRIINPLIVPKPAITKAQCVKCGVCVKMCPVSPKALDWHNDPNQPKTAPPSYRYERCIRCYCCQEVCPEGAIKIKTPLLRRLFRRWQQKSLPVTKLV
jgi:ferredoxin